MFIDSYSFNKMLKMTKKIESYSSFTHEDLSTI